MIEIPEVKETGSSGDQESSSGDLIPVPSKSPFPDVTDVVQGLAATSPRTVGGEAFGNLLTAVLAQNSKDFIETKSELKTTREALESSREDLSNSQKRVAVLEERVTSSAKGQHLRNASIVAGTILFGLAFEVDKYNAGILPFLIGGVGLLLIAMGWILAKSEPIQ